MGKALRASGVASQIGNGKTFPEKLPSITDNSDRKRSSLHLPLQLIEQVQRLQRAELIQVGLLQAIHDLL